MFAAEEKIQEGIEAQMNEYKDKLLLFNLIVVSTYQVIRRRSDGRNIKSFTYRDD